MEEKIKKWADLDRMEKFYVDILSDYRDPIHIRFLGRQDFGFKDDDLKNDLMVRKELIRKLGDDYEKTLDDYLNEKEEFEESLTKRGEELSELIYNILQAEGIKYIEEYKKLQKKYL